MDVKSTKINRAKSKLAELKAKQKEIRKKEKAEKETNGVMHAAATHIPTIVHLHEVGKVITTKSYSKDITTSIIPSPGAIVQEKSKLNKQKGISNNFEKIGAKHQKLHQEREKGVEPHR